MCRLLNLEEILCTTWLMSMQKKKCTKKPHSFLPSSYVDNYIVRIRFAFCYQLAQISSLYCLERTFRLKYFTSLSSLDREEGSTTRFICPGKQFHRIWEGAKGSCCHGVHRLFSKLRRVVSAQVGPRSIPTTRTSRVLRFGCSGKYGLMFCWLR